MKQQNYKLISIIGSALDLLAEESTTIGPNGKMLNIYSKSDRVKGLLENLFYNVINVNTNLVNWARSMCKYGDNFVYILPEKGKGITQVKQLVNYEVKRREEIIDGKPKITFESLRTNEKYNVLEVAHFRLLGDDRFLPYGASILSKIRRTWRLLILAEDAMLTYRLLRVGDRRIYKLFVGNMDDKDIDPYVTKVMNYVKKKPQINPNNSQIDYRFNILGNDEDIVIPVRGNQNQSIVENIQGASIPEIHDIEYLRDLLFTGLGIPKPFLSFQNSAGDGKNMAQMDVKMARKINRIQQALIQELNKIAIIHLYMLGLEDHINDFTLTLTNPSSQLEMLKVDNLQKKIQVYTEATRAENNGIAAMSHAKAKKEILNMSEEEIITDYKNQRIEKVINQELQDSGQIIKTTGIFNKLDAQFEKVSDEDLKKEAPDELTKEKSPELPDDIDVGAQPKIESGPQKSNKNLIKENFDDYIENYVKSNDDNVNNNFIKKSNKLNYNVENYLNEIEEKLNKTIKKKK